MIQAVKPADVATFLGRKLHGNYQGKMGNRFNVRQLGTRIKHQMGLVSIKMYDKLGIVLRIETTVNDVSFFQQYRQVQHRDGTTSTRWARMKKTIYSLPALQKVLLAANQRYLRFISDIDTPKVGVHKLQQYVFFLSLLGIAKPEALTVGLLVMSLGWLQGILGGLVLLRRSLPEMKVRRKLGRVTAVLFAQPGRLRKSVRELSNTSSGLAPRPAEQEIRVKGRLERARRLYLDRHRANRKP